VELRVTSATGASPGTLWEQDQCAAWDAALVAYPAAVEARGGARLLALDRWLHEELPGAVRARGAPYLTRDELLRLIRWKMGRGVWRANNLRLAADNAPEAVEASTRAALTAVPAADPVAPVRMIARLRGVGPATASAVLAAVFPERYPFLEDVVAAQVPGLGPPAFTVRYYGAYAAALVERAARLAAACPHGAWTPHAVDLALWTVAQPEGGAG
jgi:hypothetical protein